MKKVDPCTLKRWDIVHIKWRDPYALGGWQAPTAADMDLKGCETAGFVYRVYSDRVALVFTHDTRPAGEVNGLITVPFSLIDETTLLSA